MHRDLEGIPRQKCAFSLHVCRLILLSLRIVIDVRNDCSIKDVMQFDLIAMHFFLLPTTGR